MAEQDFRHFEESTVRVESAAVPGLQIDISVLKGGSGPPLVLLHGYPQTRYIYHKIADRLVEAGYTVLAMDLRGYGRSSKPKASKNHVEYSKREMARDVVEVAKHFGYEQFHLVAHDRGGRVAHRLVLDHPKAVRKLMILDICPTLFMYETTDREFATTYWHWFFQLLPNAEDMIAGNPEAYFTTATRRFDFAPAAREDYFKHWSTREGIHGACEDYRAAATIDLEHDRHDRERGHKVQVEALKVLWGSQGLIPKYGDVLGVWRGYCEESVKISGRAVESGHYVPEQASEDLLKEILEFCPNE